MEVNTRRQVNNVGSTSKDQCNITDCMELLLDLPYLERKPVDFHGGPLSLSKWNLEKPEKNPRSKARTNNKFNPHMGPGLHWWEGGALATTPFLLPN